MLSRLSVKSDNQPDNYDPKDNLCVDASLWVSFLTPEANSEEVKKIFDLWFESCSFFIAPSLLIFEMASAFHKKIKQNTLTQKDALHIFSDFYEHPILLFQSEKLLNKTLEFAQKMQIPMPYDASYVALASYKKVPFYTADEDLYKRAKKIYPNCHLI